MKIDYDAIKVTVHGTTPDSIKKKINAMLAVDLGKQVGIEGLKAISKELKKQMEES